MLFCKMKAIYGEITKLVLLKLLDLGLEPFRIFAVPYKGSRDYADFVKDLGRRLKLSEHQVRNTIDKLKKTSVLEVKRKENGEVVIKLTKKGRIKVLKYNLEKMIIKRPKRWDGKWRVVIFDVPDKQKNLREYFRKKIQELGFAVLQKSVYAHPFATDDDLEFLRANYKIRPCVKIIYADRIEGDEVLCKKFGIK